jgi:hypothetical protein
MGYGLDQPRLQRHDGHRSDPGQLAAYRAENDAMTETEWLACRDVRQLLEYLIGRTSDRKFRLFGCACCRRIWHLLTDERSRRVVSVAERCADGLATEDEIDGVRTEMIECRNETALRPRIPAAYSWAQSAAEAVLFDTPFWKPNAASLGAYGAAWAVAEAAWRANGESGPEAETHRQLFLLRDIFENPYRPSWVEPEWLALNEGIVVQLAQGIYDHRAFDNLPILADALEEAGCTSPDILSHCRQQGEHVPGCWVVDLCLGKE